MKEIGVSWWPRLIAWLSSILQKKVAIGQLPIPMTQAKPKPSVRSTHIVPKPGYAWNPLRTFRNVACPCGKPLKAKRCHGREEIVSSKDAVTIKGYLRKLSALGIVEARPGDIG